MDRPVSCPPRRAVVDRLRAERALIRRNQSVASGRTDKCRRAFAQSEMRERPGHAAHDTGRHTWTQRRHPCARRARRPGAGPGDRPGGHRPGVRRPLFGLARLVRRSHLDRGQAERGEVLYGLRGHRPASAPERFGSRYPEPRSRRALGRQRARAARGPARQRRGRADRAYRQGRPRLSLRRRVRRLAGTQFQHFHRAHRPRGA